MLEKTLHLDNVILKIKKLNRKCCVSFKCEIAECWLTEYLEYEVSTNFKLQRVIYSVSMAVSTNQVACWYAY